jgi:hypothetical protein
VWDLGAILPFALEHPKITLILHHVPDEEPFAQIALISEAEFEQEIFGGGIRIINQGFDAIMGNLL